MLDFLFHTRLCKMLFSNAFILKLPRILIIMIIITLTGCNKSKQDINETNPSISVFPQKVLINEIHFKSGAIEGGMGAFLIDADVDTFAVTLKSHFFGWRDLPGYEFVNLDNILRWEMYPKNLPDRRIIVEKLINEVPGEKIDEEIYKKNCLIFSIKDVPPGIHPIPIRDKPLQNGEILYLIGYAAGKNKKSSILPEIIQCTADKVERNNAFFGDAFLARKDNIEPIVSGCPVIDREGYLVGVFLDEVYPSGYHCLQTNYIKTFLSQYNR